MHIEIVFRYEIGYPHAEKLRSRPIKGDVKKKILPLPSEETWMLSLASSPVSSPGGVLVLAVLGSPAYFSETNPVDGSHSDGFMTRWCSTPSAPEATQAKRRLKCQP
jgi:hypothetical protein